MKIYIFGNEDYGPDALPFEIRHRLTKDLPSVEFVIVKLNEDLPFLDEDCPIILDTIMGIPRPMQFSQKDLPKISLSPRTSVHDFDLGFQLKYLHKIGKLKQITIVGIPMDTPIDYDSIHSILRKLVEQDIHGS